MAVHFCDFHLSSKANKNDLNNTGFIKMLKKISLPIQLLLVIFFVFFFGNFLNVEIIRFFYTFSLYFKELLNFTLPFIIFSFVLTGILSFRKNAPLILAIVMGMIFISNGLVAMLSYLVARVALPVVTCSVSPETLRIANELVPFSKVSFPALFRSDYVLLLALALGIAINILKTNAHGFLTRFSIHMFEHALHSFKKFIERLVNSIFIPFLPLYVLGFLLKIRYEGTFVTLFQQYGATVVLIICVQIIYLFWFYLLAAGFSLEKAFRYIKNAVPSYLTAFSTMSSAATIPVTLTSAKKNITDPELADMAIPIMANVHLLGDSISTPLLTLVSLFLFKSCIPAFGVYMVFVFYFCTAMFAVSGIPGGGILVMLPILRTHLGFTPEMETVITALYFLLDSFGTAANVMGDGALIIMVNKVLRKLRLID